MFHGKPFEMNRIRAARQAMSWTQDELAHKAGVSPRTVHAVEKGQRCRQSTKRRLLSALGVPWELREEYFPRVHSVRRLQTVPASATRHENARTA